MLVVAGLGTVAYLSLFMSHVPGAKEERFGELEPLPARLGEWIRDSEPGQDGLIREQRVLLPEGAGTDAEKLIVQVRYRDGETNRIERVLAEQTLKRKRVRSG